MVLPNRAEVVPKIGRTGKLSVGDGAGVRWGSDIETLLSPWGIISMILAIGLEEGKVNEVVVRGICLIDFDCKRNPDGGTYLISDPRRDDNASRAIVDDDYWYKPSELTAKEDK